MIVGISGSPILNGNTDRIIKALLKQSGKDFVFLNLSTLRYDPCRSCSHLCAPTNLCPIEDDLRPYFQPILDAEALVLGTPVQGNNITGWMFSFITRLWGFHHVRYRLKDKPVLLVVTGLFKESETIVVPKLMDLLMNDHPVKLIGHIFYRSNIPPCYNCGMYIACRIGALWRMVDRDEEQLQSFKLTASHFQQWEDCPKTVVDVGKYAQILGAL
jgi:multimeric flavodoxin WrbA